MHIGLYSIQDFIQAENQLKDEDSIFHHYKKLVSLRKEYNVIAYGDIRPVDRMHPSVFAYERTYKNETLLVICNFYGEEITWAADRDLNGYSTLIANYDNQLVSDNGVTLRPYETMVLLKAE